MVTLAALLLAACTEKQGNDFKVNVTVNNAEGEMIYLNKFIDKKPVAIDSAIIADDFAVLTVPKGDAEDLYSLELAGSRGAVNFFPENNDVTFVADKYGEGETVIKASVAQDLLNEYTENYQNFFIEAYDIYNKMMAYDQENPEDTLAINALKQQLVTIEDNMVDYQKDFIRDHADNFVSHYILDEMKQDFTLDELEELVALFTTESVFKEDLEEHIATMKTVAIGATAPDFTLETYEGEQITLTEMAAANKYTLVDFWASWCGPCRAENPNVKAAYDKYHSKGFDVLGVSVDSDINKWQEAVENDGLAWTQVLDIDHKASEAYMIYYIPNNFLIDSDGKIVATGLRDEDLHKKLAELLD